MSQTPRLAGTSAIAAPLRQPTCHNVSCSGDEHDEAHLDDQICVAVWHEYAKRSWTPVTMAGLRVSIRPLAQGGAHTWKWTKVECTERQFRENSYMQASVFVHFASCISITECPLRE